MNLRKLFRWSLRTQLIAALFAGYALLLWQRGDPWEYAGELRPEDAVGLKLINSESPDKTRKVETIGYTITIYGTQHEIFHESRLRDAGFTDNDTILATVEGSLSDRKYILFKRRFPEWWWGHFYRPEVWLLPFWLGLIAWTIRKDRVTSPPAPHTSPSESPAPSRA